MLLEKEREDIIKYCRKLIECNLTRGTGGNISILNRDKGLFAISPSGIDYYELEVSDIVILDINGNIVEGDRKPSSELELHRIFYEKRDDIDAVVHCHSVYSTVLSTIRESLPASNYLVAVGGGSDIRCAEYASFGTKELAHNAFESMLNRKAVFLANHGLLTAGRNISSAFSTALEIEFCAEVYVKAKSIGIPILLSDEEMNNMLERFKGYGQRGN